jgi:pyridoxamine 5'-phosphate oxidase
MSPLEPDTLRREYTKGSLRRENLADDPFKQFSFWLEQACEEGIQDPTALSLATVSASGRPSLRTVLLKHFDGDGFVFLTNYDSKKARDISENANVALMFPWLTLDRQLIITGEARKISTAEAFKFFIRRPHESQLSALASPQSRIVESRKALMILWENARRKYAAGKIPLPSFWGGYRVVPREFEFWQGGKHRLHDRFVYTRQSSDSWNIQRLGP